MNVNLFFQKAREAGISSCQLQIGTSTSTTISIFHHEIDSYTIDNIQLISASGIYDGKYGSTATEKMDNSSIDFLIKGIIDSARVSERKDCIDIFPGSPKYKKRTFFSNELKETPIEKKIDLIKDIEKKLFEADREVSEVSEVIYSEAESFYRFYNSYGLKLSKKANSFGIGASIVMKRGEEVKTSEDSFSGMDLNEFDETKFIQGIIEECKKKFGGKSCKSGKYPVLLDREVFSTLVGCFLSANNAIAVQKGSSFLQGYEGKKVVSKRLTIDEVPLKKGISYTFFDGEGVARENRRIVNHGVLLTHFYNRETAKKANRETTANASASLGKIGISYTNILVKPGRQTKEEIIKDIKEGIYITDIDGLGTGLDDSSGNFSCQAEGFMIRDGKIAEPLDLITLSGNLMKVMSDIKKIDNNVKDWHWFSCSDALIKSMSVGGEN